MKEFCPNKRSKEFKELASIFGEDKAYFLWMRNKGNELDKAPNGAESRLFNTLLDYFKGDRVEALKAKAKVYSNEFFNWFGDWISEDKENPYSKDISIGEITPNFDNADIHGAGAAVAIKKNDKVIGSIALNAYYRSKDKFEPWGKEKDKYVSMSSVGDAVEIDNDQRGKGYGKASYFEMAKKASGQGFVLISAPDKSRTEAATRVWKSLERDGYVKKVGDRYEFINASINLVSKVVDENGEPLVVWHGSPSEGILEFKRELIGTTTDRGVFGRGFYFSPSKSYAGSYGENLYPVYLNIKNPAYDPVDSDVIGRTYGEIAVDLDKAYNTMYDRLVRIGKSEQQAKESAERHRILMQNRNDRLKKLIELNYDGGIFLESTTNKIKPSELQLVVVDPNQIKSAVKNSGDFSATDNNIYHHIDKKISGTSNILDEIPKEGATVALIVDNVVEFLKNKFVGLSINVYNNISDIQGLNDDEKMVISILSSNKNIKSIVYHGKVYIIRSRLEKLGGQIASEEILHMLVKTLLEDNHTLFQNLLKEAREKFKKLTKEIELTYKKFELDTIDNEIVTQALARFVNKDIQQNRHSKFVQLVEQFVEWLKNIVRSAAEKFGDTVYIDPTQLKSLTLQELSNLINAKDTKFDINTSSSNSFYNVSQNSIDIAEDINTRRNEYIQNSINNWNNPNKLEGQSLQDAVSRIRDKSREQFDYLELDNVQNNPNMSDAEKQIAIGLIRNDLELVLGIQQINDIQDDSKTSKEDKEMFQLIKSGTKTRLKSFYSRSTKNARLINDLKQRLELLDGVDEDNIEDVFNQIEKFLLLAEQEILRTKRFVDSELKGKDLSTWDPQLINYIKYDLIGYYEGLLNSLYNFFLGDSPISKYNKQRVDSDNNATDLKELSTKLYEMMATLQADYQLSIVRPYADKILVDFVNESDAVKDKPAFIHNMRKWLDQDTAYGDLAAGELVLGMASRSKSPIVRIMEKMISDVEFEQNRQILAKGHELIRIYNAIRPQGSQMSFRNFLTFLMERDGEDGTEGKFTGYWVRDRNYGRFYAEKDAFEQKLREEFAEKGVTYKYNEFTDRVETIFPDEDYTADNSVYNQYYDKLDEWLDKHCERRYKLEYYKAKRRYLSPVALQAQSAIQRQIDILCQKAMTDEGWIDTSKLTATERQRRKDLLREKRELACPYIFRSLSDGTITLEEKVGEAARIAEEIRKWNDFIQSHVSYKENKVKFNQALSKFPKGSPERELFLKDNVITRINPDFWKEIFRGHEVELTQEYKDLQARYRFIVEHIKHQPGYSAQDLDLLGSGINTDSSAWKELHRIEQRMEEIRRTDGEYNENLEYIGSLLVMSTKHNKRFYDWLKEQWMYEIAEDSNKEWDFNNMFMIENKRGQLKLLKIFGMFKPQVNQIHGIPAFIDTYSSQFSEIDESSDFVNPNWKKELKSSLLPKVRKDGTARKAGEIDYTNENYLKILNDRGLKKLYDKLTSLMEEANSMIPSGATEHKYLLPQITGRGMAILGRSRSISDIFSSLNYGLQDFAGVKLLDGRLKLDSDLAERDLDVSTNWDLPRRPDGTVISNIPIRFVKRLKDPSIISSDVIGSVLMYYDMALNYKLKSENLPSLELLAEAINPERSTDGKKKLRKQYDKIKNILDYRYYGKESTMGDDNGKAYSDLKKSGMLLTKKFRKLATYSMLAINFTTIEVGYLDAFLGALADACGGKYFTKLDLMTGYWQALKSWPVILKNMGNPVVDNWMVAAMQYNQLSKSNSEIFGRTDLSKFSRILSLTRMGGYTIADYMINTMILGATYNHYRLLDMPDGSTKRFMSKSDAIDIFTKHGYTEDEAISKWEGAETTLRLAYFTKGGDFIIKREFRPYITKKLENQIAGRLRDRTAVYNGVVPMSEKALMQQNVFGSFLTLMRNFYVNTYWERALVGYDYLTDEQQLEKYGMYTEDNAGFVNFETGETGNALWISGIQGMIKLVSNAKRLITGKDVRLLTQDQKYAVKRLFSEILIIAASAFIMLYSIAFARTNDYDKDKEPLWTVNIFDPENEDRGLLLFNGNNANDKMLNWLRWKLALLATRTFTERSTFWWPGTVTELINTPSTAVSFLDSTAYVLQLFMDLFEINGHDRLEVIKSGGYKGMTRGTRDIIKIASPLGVDNIVRNWHTSGIKSTLNWYSGVSPNNLLIPNKSTWEKEQGIKSSSKSKKKNKPVY